jgi:acyl carrier protein
VKGKRSKDGLTREKLQAAPSGDARKLVESFLLEQISRVLKCSPSKVDLYQPINKLGIDSLMAVELKNRIEMDLETAVPVVVLLKGPTLAELAATLLEQLGGACAPSTAPPVTPRDTPERILAKIDELSDREVEKLLAEVTGNELGEAAGRGGPHDG